MTKGTKAERSKRWTLPESVQIQTFSYQMAIKNHIFKWIFFAISFFAISFFATNHLCLTQKYFRWPSLRSHFINLIEMRIPSEINPPLTSSIPWGALGLPVTFCPFQAALLTFTLIREVGKEVPNWFRLMAKNWYLVLVSKPVIVTELPIVTLIFWK